jgi:outer membrane protein TolC
MNLVFLDTKLSQDNHSAKWLLAASTRVRSVIYTMIVFILMDPLGVAQDDLATFLSAVQNNPGVIANRALVDAAKAQLDAVYSPVSATVSGGIVFPSYSDDVAPPLAEALPDSTGQFSIGASFRPFVYGDLADLAEQRRIALEQAKLNYQKTLAELEAQAIEAAAQLLQAETGLDIATKARDLAQTSLAVTQTRFEKGVATQADLRSAEERLLQSQQQIQNAEAGVSLAKQGLVLLVGEATLASLPELPLVEGIPIDVKQAEYTIALSKIGIASSERAFYPVAQASLALPLNDEKSEFEFSIESRTLQPKVEYSYQNPKQTAGGIGLPPGLEVNQVEAVFSIGVSATISVDQFNNLDASKAQLAAAEAGLKAAQDRANLTALSLSNSYQSATRSLELANLTLKNAELALEENKQRQEAGLAIDLEVDQATLAVEQANLGILSAHIEVLKAILSTYKTYAQPISETLEERQ